MSRLYNLGEITRIGYLPDNEADALAAQGADPPWWGRCTTHLFVLGLAGRALALGLILLEQHRKKRSTMGGGAAAAAAARPPPPWHERLRRLVRRRPSDRPLLHGHLARAEQAPTTPGGGGGGGRRRTTSGTRGAHALAAVLEDDVQSVASVESV